MNNGSDGPMTSIWPAVSAGGVARGYNVLIFDGPGQQSMLFEAERQNWEWRAKPYGLESPFDVFTAARRYNLTEVVDQITTPLLITDPEGEQFWPGQSQQFPSQPRPAEDDHQQSRPTRAWLPV